jgi:hypothetical protein
MKNKMRTYNLHHFSLIYSFSAIIVMYMFKILKKIYKIFFSKHNLSHELKLELEYSKIYLSSKTFSF